MTVLNATALDGRSVPYEEKIIGQGGMKDVYMSPDRSYVVAFYRDPLDFVARERLQSIVGVYRQRIFEASGGDYWRERFCWPSAIVEKDGRAGVVAPVYDSRFFFSHGSLNHDSMKIRGQEKEGKWFASAFLRATFLPPEEKGSWQKYLQISLNISRAVRRLHAAGLAHSDLSYKNVLVDPTTGSACVIDIDGLVVPGRYPPDVVGTPDFIAPEVVSTQHLAKEDSGRKLPSSRTDQHALAVLIYMYLFYRHPLRGRLVHDSDAARDEELSMGERALFVEHPADQRNRVRAEDLKRSQMPWGDPAKMPSTLAGPLLSELFRKSFVDGLHDPGQRPTASEWEHALVRTIDLLLPCRGANCDMGFYVFDNTRRPRCPLCGTEFLGKIPVLNLYSRRGGKNYALDNYRITVWDGQSLFPWHTNRKVFPNEHLTADQRLRVGYFQFHMGDWYLVNERLPGMRAGEGEERKEIPLGGFVKLADGVVIQTDVEEGGRLIQVQMAGR